jgi:hypothetical protein
VPRPKVDVGGMDQSQHSDCGWGLPVP